MLFVGHHGVGNAVRDRVATIGYFDFEGHTGECPVYAAPRTCRKSESVIATRVELCRNNTAPPASTN
jgi:hypothetical protein